MAGGSPFVSVGVACRNARLAWLRKLVPVDAAIVGIDLAADKQALVISDHDARVLGLPLQELATEAKLA